MTPKRRSRNAAPHHPLSSATQRETLDERATQLEALQREVFAAMSDDAANTALSDPRFLEWLLQQPTIVEPLIDNRPITDDAWLDRGQELRDATRQWVAETAPKSPE